MKIQLPRSTRLQINTILISIFLVGVQIWIFIELNGNLYKVLAPEDSRPDPVVIATIFAPTIALAWIGRHFASLPDDDD